MITLVWAFSSEWGFRQHRPALWRDLHDALTETTEHVPGALHTSVLMTPVAIVNLIHVASGPEQQDA